MSDDIKDLLNRISDDTSDLVDRVAKLEAEVSHLMEVCPEAAEPHKPKVHTHRTVWSYGPSTSYNSV